LGVPTAQSVSCTRTDPEGNAQAAAALAPQATLLPAALTTRSGTGAAGESQSFAYQKFTSQEQLGHFLVGQYNIRTPKDLTSCEVCHR
jgi:hypothetical protein